MATATSGTPSTTSTSSERQRPVTERMNPLTVEMDVSAPCDFIKLLAASDSQIFEGYRTQEEGGEVEDMTSYALTQSSFRAAFARAANAIAKIIVKSQNEPEKFCARIVMGGAGTSGRLAWCTAREVNAALAKDGRVPMCRYLIAGDDLALLTSQESAEDDVQRARRDLQRIIDEAKNEHAKQYGGDCEVLLVYIGITCGLSAPYVASQLDAVMKIPHAVNILLGFNPPEFARKTPIEGWPDHSFSTVSNELLKRSKTDDSAHVLCPVYGPESLAGSTRMKGGSTTKIVLDALLSLAAEASVGKEVVPVTDDVAGGVLASSRDALHAVYDDSDAREGIVNGLVRCSEGLRAGGHIYYVGGPNVGLFGVIDASECVPTFGARFDDVRAFVQGGWAALHNREGDLSSHGGSYNLAIDAFLAENAPNVDSTRDTVVVLGDGIDDAAQLAATVAAKTPEGFAQARCCVFAFCCREGSGTTSADMKPVLAEKCAGKCACCIPIVVGAGEHPLKLLPKSNQQLSAKLVLNCLSTGSFVAAGKVFHNRMVDLRISNAKLYSRAVALIESLTGVPHEVSEACVLRAIYTDVIMTSPEAYTTLLNSPVSEHVRSAYQKEKVVPLALLLASGVPSLALASSALKKQPVVRTAIAQALSGIHQSSLPPVDDSQSHLID